MLRSTRFLIAGPSGRQFIVYARDPFKALAVINAAAASGLRVYNGPVDEPLASLGRFDVVGADGGVREDGSYDWGEGGPAKLVADKKPGREMRA
jgi:hypothetical protein